MKAPAFALAVALAAAFGTAQLAGCASEPANRSTGRVFDDAALTAKVKAALARDKEVPAHNVNVTTYRGVVQLSGFVEDEQAARKAGEVARGVEGVQQVYNDVHAISPRSSAAGR
jgi:osmotically-inducible protein OsmY